MEAESFTKAPRRERPFGRSTAQRLPDHLLRWALRVSATLVLVVLAFFFVRIFQETQDFWSSVGLPDFVFGTRWFPRDGFFGALSMVYGTLVTSAIALLFGVPVAVATALYISELAPRRLVGPLSTTVDLLAAVPSVVFGLWGVAFLIPALRPLERFVASTLGFIPIFDSTVPGPNLFIGGL